MSSEKEKKVSIFERLRRSVEQVDYYTIPCSIQHNKKSEYKSFIGGLITLLLYMALTYYTVWRLETDLAVHP